MKNPNHPKKGSRITVDPIRNVKDIKSIQKMLSNSPRDYLLFTMGINNGLRTGDLLKLRVNQVSTLKPGEYLNIRESKTGKNNILVVNKAVHKAIRNYMDALKPEPDDYLFPSRKGSLPLSIQAVNQMLKKWTRAINLRGNYGAHTLRKTWGYQQRVTFGVGFEVLCRRYNHSSPSTTMRYLGITDREVSDVLMNEIG